MSNEEHIRKAFERWYFSQKFVPVGKMYTELSYKAFREGYLLGRKKTVWELKERAGIRQKIRYAGESLYSSIEDNDLRHLAGEIMTLNEDYVFLHKVTMGARIILMRGFTGNQETWIKNLDKKLRGVHA